MAAMHDDVAQHDGDDVEGPGSDNPHEMAGEERRDYGGDAETGEDDRYNEHRRTRSAIATR